MAQVVDVPVPVWQGCELMKAQLALEARRQRLRNAARASAQAQAAAPGGNPN